MLGTVSLSSVLCAAAAAALLYAVFLVIRHFFLLDLTLQGDAAVPCIKGTLPFIGVGLKFIANPSRFLNDTRVTHGDTFVLYMFGVKMLYTFSVKGLDSLYRLRESDASFTEATKGLLGLKLPSEILVETSLLKFHKGLKPQLMATYVENANTALANHFAQHPQNGAATGVMDLFVASKRAVHAVGLSCWVGAWAAEEPYASALISAYEQLDPEQGFQDLSSLGATLLFRKLKEKQALAQMDRSLQQIWKEKYASGPNAIAVDELTEDAITDNLMSLHFIHRNLPEQARHRQVAIDVFHFMLASQANLYASIAWTITRLLTEDSVHMKRVLEEVAEVQAEHGNDFLFKQEALARLSYLEQVMLESIRIAQQSITLRKVVKESIVFQTEAGACTLPKGWYIGTLLSVTNLDEAKAKGATYSDTPLHQFDPHRFSPSRKMSPYADGASQFTISTFGHGGHACPGRNFALTIGKIAVVRMLQTFELTPLFTQYTVPETSVGALARVAEPCRVQFQRK